MLRFVRILLGLGIAALIVAAPLAYKTYRDTHFRNFAGSGKPMDL